MLTFNGVKNSVAIAQVEGGSSNGKIVYISDRTDSNGNPLQIKPSDDELNRIIAPLLKKGSGRTKILQRETLKHSIKHDIIPRDPLLMDLYVKAISIAAEIAGRELIIYDGNMWPMPKTIIGKESTRECLYVCGPSGSGKSTYVAHYAKMFKKLYPKRDIFLFSRLDSDDVLDKLKPIRVKIDSSLVSNPIEPHELKNALVIFDDTDTIRDKELRDAIISLKNDLLETGRHQDIYVVITSHLITNYKETRQVLNESHAITFFPRSGSVNQIKYCLRNYVGLGKDDIAKLLKLPSRWVTIYLHYPQAVVYSKGAYLI